MSLILNIVTHMRYASCVFVYVIVVKFTTPTLCAKIYRDLEVIIVVLLTFGVLVNLFISHVLSHKCGLYKHTIVGHVSAMSTL
jgi:hypothetical protein